MEKKRGLWIALVLALHAVVLLNVCGVIITLGVEWMMTEPGERDPGWYVISAVFLSLLLADVFATVRTRVERSLQSVHFNIGGVFHRGTWVGLVLLGYANWQSNNGSLAAGAGAIQLLAGMMLAALFFANAPLLLVHVALLSKRVRDAAWRRYSGPPEREESTAVSA